MDSCLPQFARRPSGQQVTIDYPVPTMDNWLVEVLFVVRAKGKKYFASAADISTIAAGPKTWDGEQANRLTRVEFYSTSSEQSNIVTPPTPRDKGRRAGKSRVDVWILRFSTRVGRRSLSRSDSPTVAQRFNAGKTARRDHGASRSDRMISNSWERWT